MSGGGPRTLPYRPEVDGLRGVAVLAVVAFHAGLPLPGGFAGVDVFFVISGYLIGGIILRERDAGTFTLADFWARRVRRIVPALAATVLGTAAVAWVLSSPDALQDFGESVVWAAAMASNVSFSGEVDYFERGAESQPLLHTWSLSVEEQFYVVLPLLLASVAARRSVRGLFAVSVAASFAASAITAGAFTRWNFFLLPFRWWELGVGVLLAMTPRPAKWRLRDEAVSAAGLAAIVATFVTADPRTEWPGVSAAPIVLGTAAVLAFSDDRKTWVGWLLSRPAAVGVGLISYSLYLWHWPLLVVLREVMPKPGAVATAGVVAAAAAIAWLQWRFVETPFRRRSKRPRLAVAWGLTALLLLGLGGGVLNSADRPGLVASRLSETMLEDARWSGQTAVPGFDPDTGVISPLRPWNEGGSGRVVMLAGDSHAMMVCEAFASAAAKTDTTAFVAAKSAAIPVPGLRTGRGEKVVWGEAVVAEAERLGVTDLVLVACWSLYTLPHRPDARGTPDRRVFDDEAIGSTSADSIASLRRRLERLADRLSARGTRLWVLLEVPRVRHDEPAYAFARHVAHPFLYPVPEAGVSPSDYRRRVGGLNDALLELRDDGVRVTPSSPAVFSDDGRIPLAVGGRATYRDAGHLTRVGAERFIGPILVGILSDRPGRPAE